MRYIRLLFVVVMVSGCIPYSDNPLTAPGEQPLDQAVMGTWFLHDDDDTVFLHAGVDWETKGLRLVMVEFHKDGELKTYVLVGHTSRVGNQSYMNLRWDQPDEPDKGYLFVKYNRMGEQFGFALANVDAVEKAINEGAARGKIVRGQGASVTLTDSSERLREFVQKHDKDLFEEIQYMNRLNHSELKKKGN
jgi:hypothetical protein